jgi:nucleotide-binding universal stress UspA family protein
MSKILLPTDGSPAAERALTHAVQLATWMRAEVVVMHAYELTPQRRRAAGLTEDLRAAVEARAAELAEAVAARVRAAKLKASVVLVEGEPSDAILRAIAAEQPDMVVLGTQSGGLNLGFGVADKVVRGSPVPVTIIK